MSDFDWGFAAWLMTVFILCKVQALHYKLDHLTLEETDDGKLTTETDDTEESK